MQILGSRRNWLRGIPTLLIILKIDYWNSAVVSNRSGSYRGQQGLVDSKYAHVTWEDAE